MLFVLQQDSVPSFQPANYIGSLLYYKAPHVVNGCRPAVVALKRNGMEDSKIFGSRAGISFSQAANIRSLTLSIKTKKRPLSARAFILLFLFGAHRGEESRCDEKNIMTKLSLLRYLFQKIRVFVCNWCTTSKQNGSRMQTSAQIVWEVAKFARSQNRHHNITSIWCYA